MGLFLMSEVPFDRELSPEEQLKLKRGELVSEEREVEEKKEWSGEGGGRGGLALGRGSLFHGDHPCRGCP